MNNVLRENENPIYFDLLVDEVWPTMSKSVYFMVIGEIF